MKAFISTFIRGELGNIAVVTALGMPLLAGAAALGVETASWYRANVKLQQTADKAVYTAAIERRAGSNSQVVLSAATTIATQNGFVPGTIAVNYPPDSGAYAGVSTAIQVKMSDHLTRYFSSFFDTNDVVESVTAVAVFQTATNACALALSTSASRAIQVTGSGNLQLTGCSIMANSTASDAFYVQGAALLSTDCVISVGGVSLRSGSTTTTCPKIITSAPPVADPFASLPLPTSNTYWPNSSGSVLQPGNYTNGMNLSGTKTLSPGVYIVSGGNFSVNANANISGSGVTIYIANGTSVSMNGNATINLSAPTSGAYSGMLFFGDRSGTGGVTFNGTAASKLTGALYFANQDISYLGNFSGNGGCTQVVGGTITWSGNSNISQNCTAYGMSSIAATQLIKLVE